MSQPSLAQTTEGQKTETVIVTGSQLITSGVDAPTPVTVMTAEALTLATPRTITDELMELPVFRNNTDIQNQSTGTTGSNGADFLNLRGLGTTRTLVLLNGERVQPVTATQQVDISQIPEALVQRVDIVTGGASAAYGSDAVAGVVNFILDTKFQGLKADAQAGVSQYGDDLNYKVDVTGGSAFLQGA